MDDPREVPAYPLAEAAHYLKVPHQTLQNWVYGRPDFKSVIAVPVPNVPLLSFINLVEVHVLSSIRRKHKVSLQRVRKALDYLEKEMGTIHPLATVQLETDDADLFFRELGKIINLTRGGQIAMKETVEAYLKRIDRGFDGSPMILYPFVTNDIFTDRKPVMFNPRISFGRLVITDTGIPTFEIASRYKAGESIRDLATDYERDHLEIEDAIRCELQLEAA